MNNRLILLTVLAVALAGGTYVRAQFGDKPAKLDVVKLKEDLFVIHNDYVPGNTTVMVTNEGLILVDDKFEIDHASILAEVKKISSQPVKYVINTHHHGDHSGGNAKLQALGAQVVSSWQARQQMVDGKQPGLSNITIDNKASLYLGGKRVDLLLRPRPHQRRHRGALPGAARAGVRRSLHYRRHHTRARGLPGRRQREVLAADD